MANPCRYTEFVDTPNSTHNRITALVPENSRVLEFGCATGYMSEVLRKRRACTVTGIEIVPKAAAEAADHCDRIIVGDAEELDFDELFDEEEFDVVLFADVLEHLRDPGRVLRRVRPFLPPGGVVIASIPNVAHGSLRIALLAGAFRYQEHGLLDKTHLRFFTRESIQDLFEANGYVIGEVLRQRVEIDESEIHAPIEPPREVRELLARDPEATTYQFIVRATPAVEGNQLAERGREVESLRLEARELAALRQTVGDQSQHIDALRERNDALAAQVAELRQLLEDAHESFRLRDENLLRKETELLTRRAEELKARDQEIHWLRGVVADLQMQTPSTNEAPPPRRSAILPRLRARLRRLIA
jgi:2-polyprenyl-3-methyl-5-hydroxy-6-metoxy-1,4-benzoquinol methylase